MHISPRFAAIAIAIVSGALSWWLMGTQEQEERQ